MLKPGRDSDWPLSITLTSEIDEKTSLAVTYGIDWSGINWEDNEKSTNWCWDKFTEAARVDNMSAPPALQRADSVWSAALRKENNAFRIILGESGKSTPEEIGEPITLLFAPRSIIKFRSTAPDAKEQLCGNISATYKGRYRLMEQLVTQEWAMVASLGNDDEVGAIQQHYRAQTSEAAAGIELAFVESIYEAGLRTQVYDKGSDKFTRKFERDEAMSATVAVVQGHRNDHVCHSGSLLHTRPTALPIIGYSRRIDRRRDFMDGTICLGDLQSEEVKSSQIPRKAILSGGSFPHL
jgi:hypothetical protein